MSNMIRLTINNKEIILDKPVRVLEAALQNGIYIPTMCYYPKIESFGGCRMCLVHIVGMRKLQASCSLDAEDGMVVETETPDIHAARKAMLEFMLINHPLDCPTCDKAGECDLQDFSVMYGAASGRFSEPKYTDPESTVDPLIVRNMERCIMCTKCTRVCAELQGASAINVIGRGKQTSIEPFSGGVFGCEYCGMCIISCPVGSLMSKLHRHSYRPWDTESQSDSVCTYCGVGCGVHFQIREGEELQRVIPAESDVNQGILCARGFFGYEYIGSPKRLTTPLVRKNGKLTPATWEEAIKLITGSFKDIRDTSGGKALAAIASPKCTLEENYLLQKMMRAGLGTNNIDSVARLGLAGLRRIVEGLLGTENVVSKIREIASSGAVFSVCSDPVTEAPVLGIRVRNAHHDGAAVITLGHAPGLRRHCSYYLNPAHGTEGTILGAILSEVLEIKKTPGANDALEDIIKELALPSAQDVKEYISGDEIKSVARALVEADNVSLIAGRELAASPSAPWSIIVFTVLVYVLGAKVYLISEGPNEHGLLDMGCEPDTLPGYKPLADVGHREALEEIWGARIPQDPGLSLTEIIEAIERSEVKGLFVLGENPAFNLPDSGYVTEALRKLDFLVVQDIFMSETAELADVVLPAMAWAERDGIYVNSERKLQWLAAVLPGRGREDWRILAELCASFGLEAEYRSAGDIFAEITKAVGIYGGLDHTSIKAGQGNWPYGGKAETSAPLLCMDDLHPYLGLPSLAASEGLSLVHERSLFVPGTMSRYSDALEGISKGPQVRMSTRLAERNAIGQGDAVTLYSERGEVLANAHLDPYLPDNTVFHTNHYKSAGILRLFRYNRVPFTKTPCIYANKTGIIKR